MRIPPEAELSPLIAPDGSLAPYGPGEKPVLTLDEWRARFRDQQVAFRLAREICKQWLEDKGAEAVPVHCLFPKVASAAQRFLREKLILKGDSRPCDILLVGNYMQGAISALIGAIRKGARTGTSEVAVIPQGAAGRRSTLHVDFHTTKNVYPAKHCHLNKMVADTEQWEQSAAFILDTHPGVKKWVKNDRLGFFIPYRKKNIPANYIPDFIAVTDSEKNIVIEIKGQVTDNARAKAKAAKRWAAAVNRTGNHGQWHYLLVTDPGKTGLMLNDYCQEKWNPPFEF